MILPKNSFAGLRENSRSPKHALAARGFRRGVCDRFERMLPGRWLKEGQTRMRGPVPDYVPTPRLDSHIQSGHAQVQTRMNPELDTSGYVWLSYTCIDS